VDSSTTKSKEGTQKERAQKSKMIMGIKMSGRGTLVQEVPIKRLNDTECRQADNRKA